MTCSRCNTHFCYRCGCRRLPSLKLFGYPLEDHDLKRSIIGCNSEYKQGKPMRRAISRGALFGKQLDIPCVLHHRKLYCLHVYLSLNNT